jgi:hypothetical protein
MLLTPTPGVRLTDLHETLTCVRSGAANVRGGDKSQIFRRYLSWVDESVRLLRGRISHGDVDRLLLTRRYWHLLSTLGDPEWHVLGLVNTELDERGEELDRLLGDVKSERERWSRDGVYVVADTGCFVEHPDKIEDWDLAQALRLEFQATHLVLPILVVDQLDNLKRSKDRHTRWRARHTLHIIDSVLHDPRRFATLREPNLVPFGSTGSHAPRGEVTVEVVFDPPGHIRLPNSDDEIVDRAVAIQTLIGQPLRFLTYDTGQSTRARAADLLVTKLAQPPEGHEPENSHGAAGTRK